MSQYSAAEVMLILAALQEDAPATKSSKQPEKDLRKQPRVNRKVMLELARKQDATVVDVQERANG